MIPKISIVTPSFNQGKYLEETILSVLNQDYPNVEYIIMDGGSTDHSPKIIKKYSSRLSYYEINKDKGQSDAINKGLSKATGEIITWIGSDDLLSPHALTKVADTFSGLPPSVGLVHGNTLLFTDKKILRIDKGYALQNHERYLSGMSFPQPSTFIRKTYLDEAGMLNINYHYGMDYDLFSRLSVLCEFHYIDEQLSKYRLHKDSKSLAATHGFADDWKLIFNTIIDGLNLKSVKEELELIGLSCNPIGHSPNFFDSLPIKPVIDTKLLTYYFLTNMLKYDYECGYFDTAAKLASHLRSGYPTFIAEDKAVRVITERLQAYPFFIISTIRKIKRTLN
jgi:glycosyltransferase involved in cell wall biosynthesis